MGCPRFAALAEGAPPPVALAGAALGAHLETCAECRGFGLGHTARGVGPALAPAAAAAIDPALRATQVSGVDGGPVALPIVDPALYAKQRELGAGGMGRTYRARERRLDRVVALKQIRTDTGVDPAVLEAQFDREARLTARLQHPSIVPIYEAGRFADSNAPFYAMRLVDGTPLDRAIAQTPDLAARLALVPHVVTIAHAVAYAHEQRIVHRDLKPANIIVGTFGEAVLIDWGVACDLDEPAAALRQAVGTPAYMPPEQAAGEPAEPSFDVYALGATLYHVLAGHSPLADLRPGRRARAGATPTPLVDRVPGVPRELLAIVDKALARERRDRYASARQLADDLSQFLGGRLVAAYEYTRRERFARWLRRHRLPVAIAAVAVIALALTGTLSIRKIIAEKQLADRARDVAEQRADELVVRRARDMLASDPTGSLALLAQLRGPSAGRAASPPGDTKDKAPAGGAEQAEARLVEAEAASAGVARHVLAGNRHAVAAIAVSPDSRWIASAGLDGSVWRWSAERGDGVALTAATDTGPSATRVAYAPDGTLAAGFDDGSIRLYSGDGAQLAQLAAGTARVSALAWSRDGKMLAAGGGDQRVRVWAMAAHATPGEPSVIDAGGDVFDAAFSPDDATLAITGRDSTLRLWDRASKTTRPLGDSDSDGAWHLAWSPTGDRLAAGGRDGKTRVWDFPALTAEPALEQSGSVRALAWSSDGKLLATSSALGGSIRVWDLARHASRELVGHREPVSELAFAHDGSLVSGGLDHTVRIWDLGSSTSRALIGHRDVISAIALAPNGEFVASASKDHAVRVWSLRRDPNDALVVADHRVRDLVWAPAGDIVASAWSDGVIRLWKPGDAAPRRALQASRGARALAFDPTGRELAWVGGVHDVGVADVATGQPRALLGHTAESFSLAWSPDGRLVTGGLDETVRTWDVATIAAGGSGSGGGSGSAAAPRKLVPSHGGGVWAVAVSPDGTWVASGGYDGTLAIAPLDGSSPAHVERAHRDSIYAVAWSPDGTRLATGSVDESVRIWAVAAGVAAPKPVATLDARRTVNAIAWSPDGSHIASAAHDGQVRWWDVATGGQQVIAKHHGAAASVAVSRDGQFAASGGGDGSVWLVDLRTGATRVFTTAGPVMKVAFSADGSRLAAAGEAVQVWTVDDAKLAGATTTAVMTADGEVWTP